MALFALRNSSLQSRSAKSLVLSWGHYQQRLRFSSYTSCAGRCWNSAESFNTIERTRSSRAVLCRQVLRFIESRVAGTEFSEDPSNDPSKEMNEDVLSFTVRRDNIDAGLMVVDFRPSALERSSKNESSLLRRSLWSLTRHKKRYPNTVFLRSGVVVIRDLDDSSTSTQVVAVDEGDVQSGPRLQSALAHECGHALHFLFSSKGMVEKPEVFFNSTSLRTRELPAFVMQYLWEASRGEGFGGGCSSRKHQGKLPVSLVSRRLSSFYLRHSFLMRLLRRFTSAFDQFSPEDKDDYKKAQEDARHWLATEYGVAKDPPEKLRDLFSTVKWYEDNRHGTRKSSSSTDSNEIS
ncbi:unnamed protein product, partial [Amoebophrya sp. A25]|eukprot:GSA25T00018160001.1